LIRFLLLQLVRGRSSVGGGSVRHAKPESAEESGDHVSSYEHARNAEYGTPVQEMTNLGRKHHCRSRNCYADLLIHVIVFHNSSFLPKYPHI
jgi:hypothetical protein